MSTTELWRFRDDAMARLDLAGFRVQARDGDLGKVARTVGGQGNGYLVVEPGMTKEIRRFLLVPTGLVEGIHIRKERISLRARRNEVANAPVYDPADPPKDPPRSAFSNYFGSLRQTRSRSGRATSRRQSTRTKTTARTTARTTVRRSSPQRSRSRSRASDQPTKEELYEQAQRLGIEGRSKMSKAQLARAVGRRKGQSSRRRSSARTPANPVAVQSFLEGVGYPTGKGKLVREAERKRASKAVRETLKQLPERQFKSPTEVSKAIGKLS
jgi:Protein of unknown function (DUF2795)